MLRQKVVSACWSRSLTHTIPCHANVNALAGGLVKLRLWRRSHCQKNALHGASAELASCSAPFNPSGEGPPQHSVLALLPTFFNVRRVSYPCTPGLTLYLVFKIYWGCLWVADVEQACAAHHCLWDGKDRNTILGLIVVLMLMARFVVYFLLGFWFRTFDRLVSIGFDWGGADSIKYFGDMVQVSLFSIIYGGK